MITSTTVKNFKTAIMNIFKDGMEETNIINKQMDNLSREMETIKKNQMEFPELENTIVLNGKHH